jgi:hypothetical protein
VGECFIFWYFQFLSLQCLACHFLPTKLAHSHKHRQNLAKKSHENIFGPSVFSVQCQTYQSLPTKLAVPTPVVSTKSRKNLWSL